MLGDPTPPIHSHPPIVMSGPANSLKTVVIALGANFGIAVTRMAAAVYTGSGAMLAEAIHSLADCGNQGLLWWGMKQADRAPSADFPLGHGKAVYFWSFVVALMLFSLGGLFSVYEGWHKLHDPEPMRAPWIAVGVLLVSILLESASLAGCLAEVNKARGGRSLWRWFRETRQSELVVGLGEDLAALCGLALAFILLAMLTGNPIFDACDSIAIGLLLIVVALGVASEVQALLVGQSAKPAVRSAIEHHLRAAPGIDELLNVDTLHFGDDVMVAVKARMDELPSTRALAEVINGIEAALKRQFPQVQWVFFEPDVKR
jgi:cation diffusion facilitator family transporter